MKRTTIRCPGCGVATGHSWEARGKVYRCEAYPNGLCFTCWDLTWDPVSSLPDDYDSDPSEGNS